MIGLESLLVCFPHLDQHDFGLIYDLSLTGEPVKSIADKFDITQAAVRTVLRRMDNSRRHRSTNSIQLEIAT